MLEHIKYNYLAASAAAVLSGAVTVMDYVPAVLGSLASLFAIAWIVIQYYWARKDRKAQGK